MKKDWKHEERFARDLLEWVRIPAKDKDNDKLLMELTDLFSGYSEETIEKNYQDIMFMCELPNGQMRGKLPPLYDIKCLLDETKRNKSKVGSLNVFKDYAMVCHQCGSAYSVDQYRCLDGYTIRDIGDGYTEAVPCRDKRDPSVGPKLKKEKLVSIPKELLKIWN